MSVNDRIKTVRKVLNLSQIIFSKGIFLSNGYYADIELGNKKANDRIVELVSTKYGVNRHWLETGEGEMFDKTPPDADLVEMVTIFKELNPGYKDLILNIIGQLLKLQKNNPNK
jgi:transcriptional regulator with XRE-family HTH domain